MHRSPQREHTTPNWIPTMAHSIKRDQASVGVVIETAFAGVFLLHRIGRINPLE